MKNFIIIASLLFCTALFSQQNSSKNDIIMTTDGQLLQVKVTKVTENIISFNYPGETVINEIQSDGIDKIVFASGRTQNFNGTATSSPADPDVTTAQNISAQPEEVIAEVPGFKENTMAIVPLKFTRNGTYDKTLSNDATDYVASLTSKSASNKGIEILEKGKAIEKLVDAGVSYQKLRQSSPEELREVLGTEYLLYIAIDEAEKEKEGKAAADLDYMDVDADADQSKEGGTQLERNIGLKVYGANSEVEVYEIDLFENIFHGKASNTDSSLLAGGKWKSSLRYLTDQLFTSGVFVD